MYLHIKLIALNVHLISVLAVKYNICDLCIYHKSTIAYYILYVFSLCYNFKEINVIIILSSPKA